MSEGSGRLASLDALRGLTVAGMLLVNDPGDWDHVYRPLEHAGWNGCTPTDLVFPFFLFVMGVSVVLAILPRLAQGEAPGRLRDAALWRALRILALGLAINALAAWWLPERAMRWPGVLQRIGVCFAVVAAFAIYTPRRAWWIAIAALLAGYTALLVSGGTLARWDNIVDRIDGAVFGHYVWDHNPATGQVHDPEGLPATLPAIASSLIGLCAGVWLREARLARLLAAGVVALALGAAWSWWIPLNKNLWTPSFVLWTGGWAILALLACHWLVDRRGWPALGRRFGMNAIAAYAGSELMQILLPALGWQEPLYRHLFAGWITPLAGPWVASLAWAVAFVVLWWAIVWIMDRQRIHLKL
ncbi:MAG TPA: heparan-alpha-glucosaminide N-acetyltransferase domain-containing protein [Frateuria sp.]|uniref:acyltransferase family protein n=1 Tax=Frateuria sp. TaxID=2211372 RepID=UPI002D7F8703|nr:heparan-alpha-glucosaminide N-acetyltransferase domain-containing protein [Frateuria sp.]HET6805140.1 heparan-alpha-glucosaminide N-acetyltransferase domain-containing protein [Frateuria sp.]